MAKQKTQSKMVESEKGICINDQTVSNMRKYLKDFPDDAKITIWYDYKTYDCQICCDFEHQKKTNTAQLMLGNIIDSEA